MTQRERQVLQLIEKNPFISQQQIAATLGITRSSAAVHISNLSRKGLIAGRGYVLRTGRYAAVVGGVNVDIGGRSSARLVMADSNPGTVTVSLGGVARNIAHNLSLLGADVRFLTAYGDDSHGAEIAASCSELGIDISHALRVPDMSTSTYLYLTDPAGEMALAVSDMAVCDRITPSYLVGQLPLLQNAQVVVADTNIPAESLQYLAENCTAPLFVDPVSTAKAEKLRPILSGIHTIKPNRLEASLLSGVPIHTPKDAEKAAQALCDLGVKRVFLSMGARGIYAATDGTGKWFPPIAGKQVNTTGCGDACMAALVWAYLEELNPEQTALAGLAAASVAMESTLTINPMLSPTELRRRMLEAAGSSQASVEGNTETVKNMERTLLL